MLVKAVWPMRPWPLKRSANNAMINVITPWAVLMSAHATTPARQTASVQRTRRTRSMNRPTCTSVMALASVAMA